VSITPSRSCGTGSRRSSETTSVAGSSPASRSRNEPDLTYSVNLARSLSEYTAYAGADYVNQWPRLVPATSENIGTWQSIRDRTINTRWFWDWPVILDSAGGQGQPGGARVLRDGPRLPMARTYPSDPCRCPTIERRLLHIAARLAFHGRQARRRLHATWPWAHDLAAAFARLKTLPAPAG
jgi:hypothetical protein